MKVKMILNTTGCVITIGFGIIGLLFPGKAAALTGLKATMPSAIAEFRGTLGGAFIVMGLVPLILKQPTAYLISGFFWWGAFTGRLVSCFVDNGFSDPKNWEGLIGEFLFGLLLVIGNLKSFQKK